VTGVSAAAEADFWVFSTDFDKIHQYKFREISSVAAGLTDTVGHT
jgi:hypothetical protein